MVPALHPRLRGLAQHPHAPLAVAAGLPDFLHRHPHFENHPVTNRLRDLALQIRRAATPERAAILAAELLDLVEAITLMHHEAGHAAAYYALTPASQIRLVRVTFDPQEIPVPGFDQFAAVVRELPDTWPGNAHEALLELACLLAGPLHTPEYEGRYGQAHMRQDVALQGTDALRVSELLDAFAEDGLDPEAQRREAKRLATDPALLPPIRELARVLFDAWEEGQRDVPGHVVDAVLARHLQRPRA